MNTKEAFANVGFMLWMLLLAIILLPATIIVIPYVIGHDIVYAIMH